MDMKNDCDQMSHNEISKNRQNVSDKNFYSFFLTVPSLSTIRKVTFLLNLKKFQTSKKNFILRLVFYIHASFAVWKKKISRSLKLLSK